MSLARLWLFLGIALPVLAAVIAPLSTVDLAYQLRAGVEMLAALALPTVDTWTFTAAGLPWVDQQWGAQVVFGGVHQVLGWTGLVLLRAALTGLIVGCLALIARRRGLASRTTALLVIAAFMVAAPAMGLRPQLFGMACFAVVLVLVADRRAHPGRLWAVPVVVALWANLHGSFFLGPLVLGLAWLEDVAERVASPHRTLAVALAAVLAACLTPFGPMVWVYAVGLSTNPEVTARITEWQPTDIRSVAGLLFFASAAGIVVLMARRGQIVPWPTLLWFATFAAIALYAERGIAWWPLAVVPAVAGTLIAAAPDPARVEPGTMRRLNAIVAGALIFVAVALLPIWKPVDPRTGAPGGLLTDAPPALTAALRDAVAPGDHVFNPQPWGSWFEFAVPDALVAIDSRIELFPPEVWDDYEAIVAGLDGWQDRLSQWDVDLVVVNPDHAALRDRLLAARWETLAEDADGALLVAPS
jgi:hypothetical protein